MTICHSTPARQKRFAWVKGRPWSRWGLRGDRSPQGCARHTALATPYCTSTCRRHIVLHSKDVPLSQSALLVIDAQNSFKATPRWERRNNRAFESNVAALVDAYPQAKLAGGYFLHHVDDPGFETTSPHYRLMDFLSPAPDEPVVHKDTRNVFTSTNLQA